MKQVAAAIAIRDGLVLVTRRGPGENLEGCWEFPGGKLEPGETPQECIVRELAEELGARASAGEIITQSIYDYPGGAINLIAVEVTLHETDFELTVHDAVQ
ncbi:MAG: NUDIX domain-containing protein, partial [Novosphingobium sp.]|nr:NUDIX domain-containing protein [Novosphingobium sp.]